MTAQNRWSGWLGIIGLPQHLTRGWLMGFRALSDHLTPWPRWLGIGAALGLLPVGIDYLLGWSISQPLTALLGVCLLLAAVARDRVFPALSCLIMAIISHSIAMIALAAFDAQCLAVAYPPGQDYWVETSHWLRTGESLKYDLGYWLPVHVQLAAVMLVWGYLSLGLIPILQGMYELDLMNFYVGQYLAHTNGPAPQVILAWHPWSMCRGIGFAVLTYEIASLSLARLTGEPLSSPSLRVKRWAVGIGFLLLDIIIKWTCSETVRQALAGQLAN